MPRRQRLVGSAVTELMLIGVFVGLCLSAIPHGLGADPSSATQSTQLRPTQLDACPPWFEPTSGKPLVEAKQKSRFAPDGPWVAATDRVLNPPARRGLASDRVARSSFFSLVDLSVRLQI